MKKRFIMDDQLLKRCVWYIAVWFILTVPLAFLEGKGHVVLEVVLSVLRGLFIGWIIAKAAIGDYYQDRYYRAFMPHDD